MTSRISPPDAFTSLPAGRQATPAAVGASRGPQAFYSLASASGVLTFSAEAHLPPLRREGGECCPAPIQDFLAEWIAKPAQSSLYINPPRPDYGPQYNGVGECPF